MKTDPDVKDLISVQVKSFVVSVCFGNVVTMTTLVIGDYFDSRMPLLCMNASRRQLPFDPHRQLGTLLVGRRNARHADQ